MATLAAVRLWGRRIGAVALEDNQSIASFQYDPAFIRSQIELSPLVMPLGKTVYRFPSLSYDTFHGLPGLLADSLPDKFGNALIDAWLATQGRDARSFNAIERLCYLGTRGMGALEFSPATGPKPNRAQRVRIDALVALAQEVLLQRQHLSGSLTEPNRTDALIDILRVGTSAAGARAKAIVAWNPKTQEVRSGQGTVDAGFEHWLIKFDGVSGNKDKELDDSKGYGAIEYAYSLMAKAAGIVMTDCRLLEENGRRHFMTRRFDRLDDGSKCHMQSLGALAHYDFNQPGAYSYEQVFSVMHRLALSPAEVEEQFRRMAFNVIARNQDDHVKNIAFLMDQDGHWSLSPAFDVTYSFNQTGLWTGQHQLSINGKRDDFVLDDLNACAKVALMKRGRAKTIIEQVRAAVVDWPSYAEKAGVEEAVIPKIQAQFRMAFR